MHAFLLGIASIAVLVVMDALIKHLGQRHSAPALVSIRFVATALWLLPLIILWRIDRPDTSALRRHGLRSALTVVSNGLFFYALAQLPLADVFALSFLGPIFIALLGVAVLGERLDLKGGLAIGMAFLGMLMIVRGGLAGGASGPWPVAGLLAALGAPMTYALSITLLKTQAASEPPISIVFVQSILAAVFAAPLAAATWQMPALTELWLFAAVGLLSASGYLMLVKALSQMSSVRYAIVEFTGLIWAAALGFLVFSEVPGITVWLGSAAIAVGCLIVARTKDARKADVRK